MALNPTFHPLEQQQTQELGGSTLGHALHNKEVVNHNEMRVRITDADGNKLVGIHHPVVLNFDLRPKII